MLHFLFTVKVICFSLMIPNFDERIKFIECIFSQQPKYFVFDSLFEPFIIRDGSGSGESGYSSKPAPFGPGMDYTYWTVDVYGDTRINPHGDGGGDGLTLTPAPYPPRPRYPLNK